MSVAKRFKGYFLHGLAVLLPSILTIWLFVWGYNFIHKSISQHINRGIVYVITLATYKDTEISDDELRTYVKEVREPKKGWEERPEELNIYIKTDIIKRDGRINKVYNKLGETWLKGPGSLVGFIIALISVCVVGVLLASYVGKTLWRMAENFIMNTPILKSVYPYIKQITDFFLSEQEDKKKLFSRVVAVEYPRKGIWSVGFATGSGLPNVVNKISDVSKEYLTIFIPTSPTPFTGFVITVPKALTIELNITIEEAFRFVVSGGVINPTLDSKKMNEDIKESTKNTSVEN
ncbi:MAG: DUF502 domain-containing protein [Sedimentisphaerales bacterium]|nr:DUF502 domain-containing protein [Sedimentisphaerales bacterium]